MLIITGILLSIVVFGWWGYHNYKHGYADALRHYSQTLSSVMSKDEILALAMKMHNLYANSSSESK